LTLPLRPAFAGVPFFSRQTEWCITVRPVFLARADGQPAPALFAMSRATISMMRSALREREVLYAAAFCKHAD
jgi:hypothetical protein